LFVSILSYGQECSPYHNIRHYEYDYDVRFSVSAGACYHYNSLSFSNKYKNITTKAVVMRKSRRMPMMEDEVYLVAGYENGIGAGTGWSSNGWVYYISYDYKLYRFIYFNSVYYQTNYNMSHIVIGFKITI